MTQCEAARSVPLFFNVVTVAFRIVAGLVCFAGVVLPVARGQGAAPVSGAEPTEAEVAALLARLASPWSLSATVYGDFGYNDNVLLSHTGEERSGFAHAGFDALLGHALRHKMDGFSFYVSGDGRKYFSSETVDH